MKCDVSSAPLPGNGNAVTSMTSNNDRTTLCINLSGLDVHGLQRMSIPGSSPSVTTFKRVSWTLVLMTCLLAAIYTIIIECATVYSTNQQRLYQQQQQQYLQSPLPAVTICNLNPYRLTEAARRHWPIASRDSSGNIDLLPWNPVNVSSYEVFLTAAHRLDKQLLGCHVNGVTSCNALNFSRTFTDLGLCYTFNVDAESVRLILNTETYEYTALASRGTGLLVQLNHAFDGEDSPRTKVVRLGGNYYDSFLSTAGVWTDIIVESNGEDRGDVSLTSPLESSSHHCISDCLTKVVESHCECRPFWAPQPRDIFIKVCSIRQHLACVVSKLDQLSTSSEQVVCAHCIKVHSRYFLHHSTRKIFTAMSPATSALPVGLVSDSRLTAILSDRCHAAEIRALTCPMTSSIYGLLMKRFMTSLREVADGVEQLRAGLTRAEFEFVQKVDELTPRLAFHIQVGLFSVRKSFVEGFVSAFESVRDNSLWVLVGGHGSGQMSAGHETVAQLERAVKQLSFTPVSETVARKVLYYVADNMLSGKLEISIQALDNLTKVYYAFVNAEPVSTAPAAITSRRRYDLHLLPYTILSQSQDTIKRCYTGISENVAGLIETILVLKTILKDVFTLNSVNETLFDMSLKTFLRRTHQIKHFTNAFQSQVIQRSLDYIESRADELRSLNRSITVQRAAVLSQIASQLHTVDGSYSRAVEELRLFANEIANYQSDYRVHDDRMTSSPRGLSQLAKRVTWSGVSATVAAADALRSRSAELKAAWRTASVTVGDTWRRLIDDELLRNFYLNVYNDVTEAAKHPGRAVELLRSLLDVGRLPMPYASHDNGTRYQLSELYAALNADIPLIEMTAKLSAMDRDFRLLEGQSDAEVVIGHRPDAQLMTSHRLLADRLEAFHSTECQLNNELVRDNIAIVDLTILPKASKVKQPMTDASSAQYPLVTLLAHIGGLLALFLGASLITCLELLDVIIQGSYSLIQCLYPRSPNKSAECEGGNAETNHAIAQRITQQSHTTASVRNVAPARVGEMKAVNCPAETDI